jgi:cytochrome oxidase assembly protein ShyY1
LKTPDSTSGSRDPSGGLRRGLRRGRLLPTVLAIMVFAAAMSLGQWQLRRADEKRAMQAQVDAAAHSVPVSIAPEPIDPAAVDGRRVAVRGRWVADQTVFIDNRTYRGVAGFYVVTPVKIEGSDLQVLVMRGWVARDAQDRLRLPPVATPEGPVEVEGLAQARIPQVMELQKAPVPGPGDRIWENLDYPRFEQWSGARLQQVLIRQSADSAVADGLVRDWPKAGLDVDRHLGYAFQWFLIAAVTAGLWIYFNFFKRRDHSADA